MATAAQPLLVGDVEVPSPTGPDTDDEYGAIFTRRWVVDLILDLAGYTADRDLASMVAVEPSCGAGAFVLPMVERLLASTKLRERPISDAYEALVAVDLLAANVASCRDAIQQTLRRAGIDEATTGALVEQWVRNGDFLLGPPTGPVDFVLGNPPYIRLEAVPPERSAAYRQACPAMGGRADIYVGFYERGLLALADGGTLAFICADRWMRNSYGAKLRALVGSGWSVEAIVSLTDVDAFEDEVDAYPAITVIRRQDQTPKPFVVEGFRGFGSRQAQAILDMANERQVRHAKGVGYRAARLNGWFKGSTGWPHGSPDQLALIANLEEEFPPLEDPSTGTRVGIGVATGADKVFIIRDTSLAERERLLPLALPRDIARGAVNWSGHYLVNPWDSQGLVDLSAWPLMASYLSSHQSKLAERHTAKNGRWYKTIDRVAESLTGREKLYIPDFKEAIFPVLDTGRTYPHHNLYWITSDHWDMRVLGGLLLSDVANLFIEAYSVRMRGGFLRFQAQYLRRIRLPSKNSIDSATAEKLATAFVARDRASATNVALGLYGLRRLPS